MEERFASIGRIEAISKLYEGTGYKAFDKIEFEADNKSFISQKTRTFIEGTDFDLTYFPLKHLGYKAVVAVTGELYAELAKPKCLNIVLGVSAKLDFEQIKIIWEGVIAAAKEHRYVKIGLDIIPSRNGLNISISAMGETPLLTKKRKPKAKSMDLICISGNLGAAYIGLNILEREKAAFNKNSDDKMQPQLDKYRHFIGEYLKPEINPYILDNLNDSEIIPSNGYLVSKGLADAIKSLVRDTGLGAKIYAEKMPFLANSIDFSKELNIDPLAAALNGGEDYKLLFTIPIDKHDKFRHDFQVYDIIGHLAQPEVGASIVTPDGVELPIRCQGWKD